MPMQVQKGGESVTPRHSQPESRRSCIYI